jgi:hypothetical protein
MRSTDIKISGNNAITKIGYYNVVRSLEERAYSSDHSIQAL